MRLSQLGTFWESFSSIQKKRHTEKYCSPSLGGHVLVEYGPDPPCVTMERLHCIYHFRNFSSKVFYWQSNLVCFASSKDMGSSEWFQGWKLRNKMTRVHILSLFLTCHHQTKFLLASWPQDGCYSSRHHTKAMPARVRKEVVNIWGPFSPWKESFPRVHFQQT